MRELGCRRRRGAGAAAAAAGTTPHSEPSLPPPGCPAMRSRLHRRKMAATARRRRASTAPSRSWTCWRCGRSTRTSRRVRRSGSRRAACWRSHGERQGCRRPLLCVPCMLRALEQAPPHRQPPARFAAAHRWRRSHATPPLWRCLQGSVPGLCGGYQPPLVPRRQGRLLGGGRVDTGLRCTSGVRPPGTTACTTCPAVPNPARPRPLSPHRSCPPPKRLTS